MKALLIAAVMLASAAADAAAKDKLGSQYVRSCATEKLKCAEIEAEFLSDYRKALRGDYQGQRNVAFCLITGCDGAISTLPITGCAWRMLIVASGSLKVDSSDTFNLDGCRRQLTNTEWIAAGQQAKALAKHRTR